MSPSRAKLASFFLYLDLIPKAKRTKGAENMPQGRHYRKGKALTIILTKIKVLRFMHILSSSYN